MKYIKDQENLSEKRVLLRLDLNVPIKNGIITDQTRIDKVLPVINFLIKKRSKILIISHVGRPKGKINKELSLKPICENLEKKINQKVGLIRNDILGLNRDDLKKWIEANYRTRLAPEDLADPALLNECRQALDQLTTILKLGPVYDFQLN